MFVESIGENSVDAKNEVVEKNQQNFGNWWKRREGVKHKLMTAYRKPGWKT